MKCPLIRHSAVGSSLRICACALAAMLLPATTWATGRDQVAVAATSPASSKHVLRVCADPNNLPFSNKAGQGFENHLAQLLGDALHEKVEYTWWAQRRGFLRSTLNAGHCDVVMGLPSDIPLALTTQPYYRSSYVLVYRKDKGYDIRGLDDPQLKRLRIGVHLIGDENPPPAMALAQRGITKNVVGYSIYGDYRQPNPPLQLIKAVAHGDIDVAIAWGPMAGYLAKQQPGELAIVPLTAGAQDTMPFEFSISMGVRRNDAALKTQLDSVLRDKHQEIQALLDRYNVPRVAIHPNQLASGDY